MTLKSREEKAHQITQLLLPWHINDTLRGKEAGMVLQHLQACEACRQERDRLHLLQELISDAEGPSLDARASLKDVRARIEVLEKLQESVADVDDVDRTRYWSRRKARRVSAKVIKAGRFGLAASLLALLVAGGTWMVVLDDPSPVYQTLNTETATAGETRGLELAFGRQASSSQIRQALLAAGASIVSGPTVDGVYRIKVVIPTGVSEHRFLHNLKTMEGMDDARFID